MAENKMVSIEKMDEILNDYYPETTTEEFHGQEIVIKKLADLKDMMDAVEVVSDGCFADDGTYMPELLDFMMRTTTFELYTNIRLPKNPEHLCRMLYCDELWNLITRNISTDQTIAMHEAVLERIDARNNANRALFEAEIQKAVASMQSIGEQFEALMKDVSPEDIKALVGAIGKNGIDEEKLVQTVVEKQNALREQQASEAIEGGQDGE